VERVSQKYNLILELRIEYKSDTFISFSPNGMAMPQTLKHRAVALIT